MDNVNASQKTPSGTLSIATNVDIKNAGVLARRRGYALLNAGNYGNLWGNDKMALAVKNGTLVRVYLDGSTVPLGNYPVDAGVTYVDGLDGYVYCASYGFMIRVDENNDVYTPVELDSTESANYSQPNIADYDVINPGILKGQAIIKRNKTVIKGATVLEVYKGKLYAAMDNVVWHSDSYDFMRMLKTEKNYLNFSGRVTAIKAIDSGVYISEEDKIWFLRGSSPADFNFTVAYDAGIEAGTELRIDKITIGEQTISPVIMWTTRKGICIGTNDGQVINLTEERYDMPSFTTGAAMFRQEGGLDQYLTVLNS